MRIYVATSWRNPAQPAIVQELREAGHEVYDFRNPAEGDIGFHWYDIDPEWQDWDADEFVKGLQHPLAVDGYGKDIGAMEWADVCVMALPCGKSAHLEAGWFAGAKKLCIILLNDECQLEPELMYKMTRVATSMAQVRAILQLAGALSPREEIEK